LRAHELRFTLVFAEDGVLARVYRVKHTFGTTSPAPARQPAHQKEPSSPALDGPM
jgi:hypothetical protein